MSAVQSVETTTNGTVAVTSDKAPVVATLIAAPTSELQVIYEINKHHRLAHEHSGKAKEHAIECGRLLNEMKAKLSHGDFGDWIKKNCTFKRSMAALYMKAAKNPTALEKSPLRSLNMSEERKANPFHTRAQRIAREKRR